MQVQEAIQKRLSIRRYADGLARIYANPTRAASLGRLAGLMGAEGGHAIENSLDNLGVLADAGGRFFDVPAFAALNEVAEALHGLVEEQMNVSGGAVTLFGYVDFSDAPVGIIRILVIYLVAVDKGDDIRILFYGTGLTEVRENRTFVGSIFYLPVEL